MLRKRNKKGAVTDMVLWVIIVFIVGVFFAGWLFIQGNITNAFMGMGTTSDGTNITNITATIMKPTSDMLATHLHTIALIIIFGMVLSIFITNFFIKSHPIFYIFYILVIIVAVIISAYISNLYMGLMTNDVIGTNLQGFTGLNYIVQWLPYWVAAVGIFGAIFLFVELRKREDALPGGYI